MVKLDKVNKTYYAEIIILTSVLVQLCFSEHNIIVDIVITARDFSYFAVISSSVIHSPALLSLAALKERIMLHFLLSEMVGAQ